MAFKNKKCKTVSVTTFSVQALIPAPQVLPASIGTHSRPSLDALPGFPFAQPTPYGCSYLKGGILHGVLYAYSVLLYGTTQGPVLKPCT